jgi:23S rRNA pseudouridine2605 synthase
MKTRLQKIIADAGLASRREAERWIEEGKVSVNKQVVTELGTLADPVKDRILVDGKAIPRHQESAYLILNKPTSCLTTTNDDKRGRTTVMEFVRVVQTRVFPVGRLDFNTQGLLLFTNDGQLSRKLLDPRYGVERTYKVKISGVPTEKTLKRLARGVHMEEGQFRPIEAKVHRASGKNCFLILTLTEGKNRHIKRVCEHIGHPVIKLQRTHFAGLSLTGLPLGACRFLSPKEVKALKALVAKEPEPVKVPARVRAKVRRKKRA